MAKEFKLPELGENISAGTVGKILVKVGEVIAAGQTVTGRKVPARDTPRRAGDPAVLVAAAGRAAEKLGWKPKCSELKEIVRTAFDWHAAQGK